MGIFEILTGNDKKGLEKKIRFLNQEIDHYKQKILQREFQIEKLQAKLERDGRK